MMNLSEKPEEPGRLLAEDHGELGELLSALVAGLDGGDAAGAFSALDLFWARLAMHIRAENLHLFPAILGATADAGSQREAREAITQLRADHDFFMTELARAVQVMRGLTASPGGEKEAEELRGVRQIVGAVSARLGAHNRLEEEQVYRLPATLLAPAEQSALAERMRREIENLPPRFK